MRCFQVNSLAAVRAGTSLNRAELAQKMSNKGVYWKGVTERTLVQITGSFPLLQRRIVVRSPVPLNHSQLISDSDGVYLRPESYVGTSDGAKEMMSVLFGSLVPPSLWMTKRIGFSGATVLEDKPISYAGCSGGGSARIKKFYNGLNCSSVYDGPASDFTSVDSAFTNVYVVDIFCLGQVRSDIDSQFMAPKDVSMDDPKLASLKQERGSAAGLGSLSVTEPSASATVDSSYSIYWSSWVS